MINPYKTKGWSFFADEKLAVYHRTILTHSLSVYAQNEFNTIPMSFPTWFGQPIDKVTVNCIYLLQGKINILSENMQTSATPLPECMLLSETGNRWKWVEVAWFLTWWCTNKKPLTNLLTRRGLDESVDWD